MIPCARCCDCRDSRSSTRIWSCPLHMRSLLIVTREGCSTKKTAAILNECHMIDHTRLGILDGIFPGHFSSMAWDSATQVAYIGVETRHGTGRALRRRDECFTNVLRVSFTEHRSVKGEDTNTLTHSGDYARRAINHTRYHAAPSTLHASQNHP